MRYSMGSSAALLSLAVLAGCGQARTATDETAAPPVQVQAVSALETGAASQAVVVLGEQNGVDVRIVAAAETGGLVVSDLGARAVGGVENVTFEVVDVRHRPIAPGQPSATLAAVDAQNQLRLYAPDGDGLQEVTRAPVALGFAAEGLCLGRNATDGLLYAFVTGRDGQLSQYLLHHDEAGTFDARLARGLHLSSEATFCVADDAAGHVYVAEEGVGIWRFNIDPENDPGSMLVDVPRLGVIGTETAGLAVYNGGEGAHWLLASDVDAGTVQVYDISSDYAHAGEFALQGPDGSPAGEIAGLFASAQPHGGYPTGLLLAADDDQGHYLVVSFDDVAGALGLATGTPVNPRQLPEPRFPAVTATVETKAVHSLGDAADDPAIWANRLDPAASVVIGTDKRAGLVVYDMQGQELQFVENGRMNNVDLREGFSLGGQDIILVTASDRTRKAISIFRLDPVTRTLHDLEDGLQETGFDDPYGQCMYRSASSGRTYTFINDKDGTFRQWEMVDAGNGRVGTELVREFSVPSQPEGCVADDEKGELWLGEENAALWLIGAEPDAGTEPELVERIEDNPALADDFEGVGLYDLGDGRGYVVASSQGNNSFAVYRREGEREYLGSFVVVANPALGIDGVSETDGLEVTSRSLGPGFEHGAVVVQDGANVMPVENQNFKYVPWKSIADALELEVRQD